MARPKRIVMNTGLDEAIKIAAWDQIQELGASALTLRGIARALGIAAPSIYHYYSNRDELVTALIVDAFNAIAESQHAALASALVDDPSAQLTRLALAYRQWAIQYPQRYLLVFGTPIPGYVAPEEITLPAAASGFVPITQTVQAALTAGRLRVERLPPLTPALKSMLEAWQEVEEQSDIEVLYLALVLWSRMHGLVMFEVNGQYPSFITDAGEIFQREMNQVVDLYFN
jgi:AcrR family transcriptional regulator